MSTAVIIVSSKEFMMVFEISHTFFILRCNVYLPLPSHRLIQKALAANLHKGLHLFWIGYEHAAVDMSFLLYTLLPLSLE